MRVKIKLYLLVIALLLASCRAYAQETIYSNTLTCQNYTDYQFFAQSGEEYNFIIQEEGANCSYTCPDGTVKESNIPGTISSLYSSSKEELDVQLCGVAAQATPEQTLATATVSPTLATVLSPTPTSSPTRTVTATVTATSVPLLTGLVSMCDLGSSLINFRIVEPAPNLTGKTLEVKIDGQDSACSINSANPALLTCPIPSGVSFPAGILVRLDGIVVNEFVFSGSGCLVSPRRTPTPRPRISYP